MTQWLSLWCYLKRKAFVIERNGEMQWFAENRRTNEGRILVEFGYIDYVNCGKYLRIVERSASNSQNDRERTTWKLSGISSDDTAHGISRIALPARSYNKQTYVPHVAAINYLPRATLGLSTTCKRPRAVRVLIHHHDYTVSVQIHWEQFLSVTVYAQLCTLSSGNS